MGQYGLFVDLEGYNGMIGHLVGPVGEYCFLVLNFDGYVQLWVCTLLNGINNVYLNNFAEGRRHDSYCTCIGTIRATY